MIKGQMTYKHANRLLILVLLFSFAFILLSTVNTVSADSSVIYVNDSGGNDDWNGQSIEWIIDTLSGPKKSIKNATGTVSEGGTVNIADGVYSEENNTNIIINKNMTIKGQSKDGTIINGSDSAQIFLIQSGVNVTIHNLTLANSMAGDDENMGYGGVIENYGTLTVKNSIFTSNTAMFGGAVYNGGNLTVNDCIFTDNGAYIGGAISNFGTLNVNSSNFSGNIADLGGAIANIGNLTVINAGFINNTANLVGGAIYTDGGTSITPLTVSDSNFTDNTAMFGGAICNDENGTLNVFKSTFADNIASNNDYNDPYEGGAIWNVGTLTVNDSAFAGNIADYGGAISNYGNLTVTNGTFTSNNAIFMGGAISNYGYSIINGSHFIANQVFVSVGGAIYNLYNLTINGSDFANNTAFAGGAIYNEDNLNINGSNFTNNTATYDSGGAVYNRYGTLNVFCSTFTGNTAKGNWLSRGGAIHNDSILNVNKTTFDGNVASWGGAIYNFNEHPWNISDSTFTGNNATSAGGAVYTRGNLNVENSIFNSNNGGSNGGAIWGCATLNIRGTTFDSNIASFGGAIYTLAALNINFCQIVGNTPQDIYNPLNYYNEHAPIDANYNWWGSNDNPSERIYGATVIKWLVLTVISNPGTIKAGDISNITAYLTYDNDGNYHDPTLGHVPDGIKVNFETTLGTINDSTTVNGIAQSILKGGTKQGTAIVSAAVDSQIVNTFVIVDATPPTVHANSTGGLFNTSQRVLLTANDDLDPNPEIYYSVNNGVTWNHQAKTVTLNLTLGKTVLMFYAKDSAGNNCTIQTLTYNIDTIRPKVISTSPKNGAIRVSRTSTIAIKLSENIKASINWSKIVVKNRYGKAVSISKWISGNILYIKTKYRRSSYSYYTVYIPASALKDSAGNNAAGYTFRFKTGRY